MFSRTRHGVHWKRHVHRCSTTRSPPLYALPTRSYAHPKSGSSFCRILYIISYHIKIRIKWRHYRNRNVHKFTADPVGRATLWVVGNPNCTVYRNLLIGLSNWFEFFGHKTICWISAVGSGNYFVNDYRGNRLSIREVGGTIGYLRYRAGTIPNGCTTFHCKRA